MQGCRKCGYRVLIKSAPMGPWAHGPMGPWAHGPMGPWAWIDPGSIQDRSRIDPGSIPWAPPIFVCWSVILAGAKFLAKWCIL